MLAKGRYLLDVHSSDFADYKPARVRCWPARAEQTNGRPREPEFMHAQIFDAKRNSIQKSAAE